MCGVAISHRGIYGFFIGSSITLKYDLLGTDEPSPDCQLVRIALWLRDNRTAPWLITILLFLTIHPESLKLKNCTYAIVHHKSQKGQ